METGIELIAKERDEQLNKHKKSIIDDAIFNNHYQLSEAASLLLWVDPEEVGGEALNDDTYYFNNAPVDWDLNSWNKMMNKEYDERLIISGALIAAELDRLIYQNQHLKKLMEDVFDSEGFRNYLLSKRP